MNDQAQREWTIRNISTGEYAHLHSETECEERKGRWIASGKAAERDIEINYDPPGVWRTMP